MKRKAEKQLEEFLGSKRKTCRIHKYSLSLFLAEIYDLRQEIDLLERQVADWETKEMDREARMYSEWLRKHQEDPRPNMSPADLP